MLNCLGMKQCVALLPWHSGLSLYLQHQQPLWAPIQVSGLLFEQNPRGQIACLKLGESLGCHGTPLLGCVWPLLPWLVTREFGLGPLFHCPLWEGSEWLTSPALPNVLPLFSAPAQGTPQ